MDCRNLFNAFNSLGGKLICNYNTQTCILNKTASCNLQPVNRFDLETLVLDYSYVKQPNITFQHLNGSCTNRAHDLHFDNKVHGFSIYKSTS